MRLEKLLLYSESRKKERDSFISFDTLRDLKSFPKNVLIVWHGAACQSRDYLNHDRHFESIFDVFFSLSSLVYAVWLESSVKSLLVVVSMWKQSGGIKSY